MSENRWKRDSTRDRRVDRRSFLKAAGLGAVTAVLGKLLSLGRSSDADTTVSATVTRLETLKIRESDPSHAENGDLWLRQDLLEG